MGNRLTGQKSPYLLQHADNPVDWYPWGPEALEAARASGRPILVSIGYSACHWCHVMAHESFEDPVTAAVMNQALVNIKVDREERPDVDAIYMEAVQALIGSGGWPLNVFLTPEGRPFYGGTYFPPEPRHGLPSWRQVVDGVAALYRDRPDDVEHNARELTTYLQRAQEGRPSDAELSGAVLEDAYQNLAPQFDWEEGGFGSAPKFPQPLALELLLRMWRRFGYSEALEFVEATLERLARGGIHDHLGGGFHRYTVDGRWVVPHFEKMLYDNALLARLYTLAWQVTHKQEYRHVVESTLEYLLTDMRAQEGGFYSAEDADSEGEEGKFYVWTADEMRHILRDDADTALSRFGVRSPGNFEGKSILTFARSVTDIARDEGRTEGEIEATLERVRAALLRARRDRVPPGKDTKILVSWNGLTIRALAEAGRAFMRPDFLGAARVCVEFILRDMRVHGELVRSYRDGPSAVPAFLEDYASLIEALISLFECAFDPSHLLAAQDLADQMLERFRDDSGVLYDTQCGADRLIVRPRGLFDNPIPSGNSAAASALLRLEAHTGAARYREAVMPGFKAARDIMSRAPLGMPYLLSALDRYTSTAQQIAVVTPHGADSSPLVDALFGRYLPNAAIAVGHGDATPLLRGREARGGKPTAYVCEHFACRLPVTEPHDLASQLEAGIST